MINKQDIIHFCGIGGVGMSAIAKLMHTAGHTVQGSDLGDSGSIKNIGITVFDTQIAQNLAEVKHFVYSSAIKPGNLEYDYAVKNGINMWHRADILGYLMKNKYGIVVSGTHGKTTTTAMLADLFIKTQTPATSLVGGVVKGTMDRCLIDSTGNGYILTEGDESDKSFLKFSRKVSIVTNVDLDHMENYEHNADILFDAFAQFINETAANGICILCKDSQMLREKVAPMITHANVVWYSCDNRSDSVCAENIVCNEDGSVFDIKFADKIIKNVSIPLFGLHNIANSLAVIIAADYLKIDAEKIKSAIATFGGVKRRFDIIGTFHGATIIDDYAHHPVEIIATLKAARNKYGNNTRIIAVLQPHRYSRVEKLLNDFVNCLDDADIKIVTDIYGAFEDRTQYGDLSYLDLVKVIENGGSTKVEAIEKLLDIGIFLEKNIKPDDIVIFLGAGDASNYARSII